MQTYDCLKIWSSTDLNLGDTPINLRCRVTQLLAYMTTAADPVHQLLTCNHFNIVICRNFLLFWSRVTQLLDSIWPLLTPSVCQCQISNYSHCNHFIIVNLHRGKLSMSPLVLHIKARYIYISQKWHYNTMILEQGSNLCMDFVCVFVNKCETYKYYQVPNI